jgi:beta-glucosidase
MKTLSAAILALIWSAGAQAAQPSQLSGDTILNSPQPLAARKAPNELSIVSPDSRAAATEKAMTPDERTVLTHGILALPFLAPPGGLPKDAVIGAGYVAGVPRLMVPALTESDASLGVAWVLGLRKDGATALPSAMAMASTWNPELIRAGGAMIAGEASAKGFNVLLAGGADLMRDPRNGRTFEYLGEDPLLTGALAGAAIAGIQSAHVISTVKHFALNDQETGRHFIDVKISDAAARESDLLAFEIAIERGAPGSVMCAYNQVGGHYACDSDYLLNQVLKRDWGYKGFVMSDWGAVPSLATALDGLDQQSGSQLDAKVFLGAPLAEAAATDPRYAARLADMNRRVLRSIYAVGLDANPPKIHPIDFAADGKVAEAVAEEGLVLLRNQGGALPLSTNIKRIAVIGSYADSGVLSGAGSSQVEGPGGPAVAVPVGGEGPFAALLAQAYHRSPPLRAIRAVAPGASVIYRDGHYITDAVAAARGADVAIVFAHQWMTEGLDVPDLSLPDGQDALIAAVAAANPHTVVVLETGGPVLMPWLDKTAAVIETWYPGARGGPAIAAALFGQINPSGRLPATFPASLDQLPRPQLPGATTVEPDFEGNGKPGQALVADYDIEGSDVGYRWFARKGETPLFPFGFGLSYTTFEAAGLSLTGGKTVSAAFTVRNAGARDGADTAQLYLIDAAGKAEERLVGFQKVQLKAGESRPVTLALDTRLLADWTGAGWIIRPGVYRFALGESARDLGPAVAVTLAGRTLKP